MNPVLGIDLGTTYSAVATIDSRGGPVVLRNAVGDETTPSVVCFSSPGAVLVGAAARNAAALYPDRTVTLVKRRMGTGAHYSFDDVEYTAESVSALILRALVDSAIPGRAPDAELAAVITVPAYFGIREREATQQAAVLAGIQVLELVSEPVAAAIHYAHSDEAGIGRALVYDLGGGTFDTTVITMGGQIQVIATDGDVELGGADWDHRIAAYLLELFGEQLSDADGLDDDQEFLVELGQHAERAKRQLSAVTTHRVPLRWRGEHCVAAITRAQLESMTRDLLDATCVIVDRVLATAATKGVDVIDRCLLVGGSSHMPAVAERLRERYGWIPRLYDPDLAVAKGAALRAHQLRPEAVSEAASAPSPRPRPRATVEAPPRAGGWSGAPAVDPGGLTMAASVVARSLGLLLEDSHDPSGTAQLVHHVIHQNEPLPAERTEQVATIVDGQTTARIRLFEQAGSVESPAVEANRLVLDALVSGLAPRRGGSPLNVTVRVNLGGLISIVVFDGQADRPLPMEAYVDGVLDGPTRASAASALTSLQIRQ